MESALSFDTIVKLRLYGSMAEKQQHGIVDDLDQLATESLKKKDRTPIISMQNNKHASKIDVFNRQQLQWVPTKNRDHQLLHSVVPMTTALSLYASTHACPHHRQFDRRNGKVSSRPTRINSKTTINWDNHQSYR